MTRVEILGGGRVDQTLLQFVTMVNELPAVNVSHKLIQVV